MTSKRLSSKSFLCLGLRDCCLTQCVIGPHECTCQMASKSVEWFNKRSQMWQTTKTDHAAEKCVLIGGISYNTDNNNNKFRTTASVNPMIIVSVQWLMMLSAGRWRALDFDYMATVLSSIIAARDEFSWSSDSIPATQLSAALSDLYPRYSVMSYHNDAAMGFNAL